MATAVVDRVLTDERAHMQRSRDALAAMRAASADWQTAVGGDSVSTQYLRQQLFRRVQSLQDDPAVPLFFGRIDYQRSLGAELDEVCHIGRRHVSEGPGGDPLVIDWRAPISLPFYRARPGEPMGARLRRRFGFQQGLPTAYEDEDLVAATGPARGSALLQAEIERPRTGPMRDIVATIQPDQDVLVRTDLSTSMAIQGAPGTGKTAVGLHRAAYLLYSFRDQLTRAGVLVIGPNDSVLGYIGDVLPALGEIDATQETIDTLVCGTTGVAVRTTDPSERAVLLGDARWAEVARRAVWSHIRRPDQTLTVPIGHRVWRVPPTMLTETMDALVERGVRYEAGRQMLPQRLALQVLLRMVAAGETTDDRVQASVARSKPVRDLAAALWPRLGTKTLTHSLLSDPQRLAAASQGVLSDTERALVIGAKPPRTPGARRWTPAEVVLADEIADLLNRTPSLGHVIVDEAQDLSAMQLRAVGRRATTGSVTLLGDLAQATTPWSIGDWRSALHHVGHPEARLTELVEGFRVPGDVIDFAARLLGSIAPQLARPHSIRHNAGELVLRPVDDAIAACPAQANRLLEREGTIGLIVADSRVADVARALDAAGMPHHHVSDPDRSLHRLDLVPASRAKGLEFDHVLLVEPAALVEAEPDRITGLRRLYVCLTRAVSSLIVLHQRPLPTELD